MKLTMWLSERELNARRIADGKQGRDRDGWLEDASYFHAARTAAEDCARLRRELERTETVLANYRVSWSALRDWAQECRDQVLYVLAQRDDSLGRTAEGLGQASVEVLRPNLNSPPPMSHNTPDPDASP